MSVGEVEEWERKAEGTKQELEIRKRGKKTCMREGKW